MATQATVRRIASKLPGAHEAAGHFGGFAVEVKGKDRAFVWHWRERVNPKKPKVPNPGVVVIVVASLDDKAALIAGDPDKLFTEPHYDGYPMVLVRLAAVTDAELRKLIQDSYALVSERAARPAAARPRRRAGSPRPRTPSRRRAER
jgi:hypothetical protein